MGPKDEFVKDKTGANDIVTGRGLLEPLEEERVDEESERYFDQFRYSRDTVPASYSSVDRGYVSPIKDQRQCGSCVAFASGAVIETCFKKKVGVFGDYSEQQYLDCGFGHNGANGCNGAAPHAYLKWTSDNGVRPCHESQYPYQGVRASCPASLPVYNQGVRISGVHYTYQGDEELMKRMVYEHGAVVATVKSEGPFQSYGGGVFAGCPAGSSTDHAITVVGDGTDNGVDYWLIKNSWGARWGENGFIRLQRGVSMCGIGRAIATIDCENVAGPIQQLPCFGPDFLLPEQDWRLVPQVLRPVPRHDTRQVQHLLRPFLQLRQLQEHVQQLGNLLPVQDHLSHGWMLIWTSRQWWGGDIFCTIVF